MTTRILIANYGPNLVEVNVMKIVAGAGETTPDRVQSQKILSPSRELSEFVYPGQYLVVKELIPG